MFYIMSRPIVKSVEKEAELFLRPEMNQALLVQGKWKIFWYSLLTSKNGSTGTVFDFNPIIIISIL